MSARSNEQAYGLFQRERGTRKWQRVDALKFGLRLKYARLHWQGALLNGTFAGKETALRPITLPKDEELA